MKKNRFIVLILLSFLVSGCSSDNRDKNTIYYNLDISTYFKESLTILFDKDIYEYVDNYNGTGIPFEKRLLYYDVYPIFSNDNKIYEKKINKSFNNVEVNLSYNYVERDFVYSNYIMNCFENYDITSDKDVFEVNLSGEFYCLNDKDSIDIRVSSIFDVINSNGELDNDVYTWKINKSNKENVDIKYSIDRSYASMLKENETIEEIDNEIVNFNFLRLSIVFILIIILLVINKKYIKNN